MTGKGRPPGTKTCPSYFVHQKSHIFCDDRLLFIRLQVIARRLVKIQVFSNTTQFRSLKVTDVLEVCSKCIYLQHVPSCITWWAADDCNHRRHAYSKAINQPYRGCQRHLSAGHIRQILTSWHTAFISPTTYSSVRFISCLLTCNYSTYILATLFCLAPRHYIHVTVCMCALST
jgi:hypothetical protein